MPANKRKRQPNRTPREHIEDYFFDATLAEQAEILKTLATVHRMKQRFVGSIAESAIEAAADNAQCTDLFGSVARRARITGLEDADAAIQEATEQLPLEQKA